MAFYLFFQDELKAMDDMIKEATRREERKHRLLSVFITVSIAFFIYVLIHLI
jgi:hypothetical protein